MDTLKILKDFEASLQEIGHMMEILGRDCYDLYLAVEKQGHQVHKRAYVRSVFAFIEGVLYRIKITAAHYGVLRGNLSPQELVVLEDMKLDIDSKGKVSSKPLYPPFLNNVKFTFKIYSKTADSTFQLSTGGAGWQSLCDALKVRNRLMHPKEIIDLEVTDTEIETTKKAVDWFIISYAICSLYAQRALQVRRNSAPESVAKLDEQIAGLEAQLLKRGN